MDMAHQPLEDLRELALPIGYEIIAALLAPDWTFGGTRGGLFIGIKSFIG